MGQKEVLDLLNELRKTREWYTSAQIKKKLLDKGYTETYVNGVYGDLMRLSVFDIIQCKGIGIWNHHKVFRAYKQTLNKKCS